MLVPLPDGRYAFGRVMRDAAVCFYRESTVMPGQPPIGRRDFAFCVGVRQAVVDRWEVVGSDPFDDSEDDGWPPPMSVQDPLASDRWSVYSHGAIAPSTWADAQALEPAAVWDEVHLLPRLTEELDRE